MVLAFERQLVADCKWNSYDILQKCGYLVTWSHLPRNSVLNYSTCCYSNISVGLNRSGWKISNACYFNTSVTGEDTRRLVFILYRTVIENIHWTSVNCCFNARCLGMYKLNAHVSLFRRIAFVHSFNLLLTHWKKKRVIKQHSLYHKSITHLVLENPYNIFSV